MQYLIPFAAFMVIAFALGTTVGAQQIDGANPDFLRRALDVIVSQRNAAMDQSAATQVQLMQVRDELAKAQAKIKEMESTQSQNRE